MSSNQPYPPEQLAGSDLERYFRNNKGRLIHKWSHYFDIYERHLSRFRGRPIRMLEIGISHGGSLQMWRQYFGPSAHIIGCDIDERCRDMGESQVEIIIGDQGDRRFLSELRTRLGTIDILLDDGGHEMNQQRATLEELYPIISPNGVYLCEDVHTSYWSAFGGGFRKPGSFIEYSKNLIDQLNAWHTQEPDTFSADSFTRTAHSMHFYDSIVVIEKRPIAPPTHTRTGKPSFSGPRN